MSKYTYTVFVRVFQRNKYIYLRERERSCLKIDFMLREVLYGKSKIWKAGCILETEIRVDVVVLSAHSSRQMLAGNSGGVSLLQC